MNFSEKILAVLLCGVTPFPLLAENPNGAGHLKHPDWHPSGRMLAAEGSCAADPDLYLVDLDSAQVSLIFKDSLIEGYPRWFPDGRRLIFHQIDPERRIAHLLEGAWEKGKTLEPHVLVGGESFNIEPAISPDGLHLVYSTSGEGSLDLSLARSDGFPVTRWRTPSKENFPSFLSSNRAIIFHAATPDEPAQIWLRDIESGLTTRLTKAPGPNLTGTQSTDGRWLVYASERDGDREIYLLDLVNGDERRLTHRPGRDGYPKFSPDGQLIALHSELSGSETVVRILDLDGQELYRFGCPGSAR